MGREGGKRHEKEKMKKKGEKQAKNTRMESICEIASCDLKFLPSVYLLVLLPSFPQSNILFLVIFTLLYIYEIGPAGLRNHPSFIYIRVTSNSNPMFGLPSYSLRFHHQISLFSRFYCFIYIRNGSPWPQTSSLTCYPLVVS